MPAMKKVSGGIKLELAQYRELVAFSQFGSELDKATADKLNHGERIMEIMKQGQYSPMEVEDQVMILFAVTNKMLADVEVDRIKDFETNLLEFMKNYHPQIGQSILEEQKITDETREALIDAINEFKKSFS